MTSVVEPQLPLTQHDSHSSRSSGCGPAARWLLALLVVLSLPTIGLTIWLKCDAMASWRYTSDMFIADTMLQETLRGHFVVEYTYGRQFGDHALLILLFL